MLFLALLSASLKSQSSLCAVLCFFEKPKLFLALRWASLKPKALFALCSALSQSSFFEERSFKEFSLVCSSPAPHQ